MENQGLDKFDESLLELLQRDAKQSMADVAAAVGLSEPACYRRIRRLRDTGVIEREVAIVRPRTMGWPLSMIVLVTLETDRSEVVDGLIRRMRPIGEVLDVWYVTGDQDLVLHVIARDMEYFDRFARRVLHSDANVRSFKTLVVMRHDKKLSPIPAMPGTGR